MGASPREVRGLLLDAAQHPGYPCLSPFAVLEGLGELSKHTAEFDWLRRDPAPGGYHEPAKFLAALRARLLDRIEDEVRSATGLVDEARYAESFERYVHHVSASLKGEKIVNRLTGRDEPPDATLMHDIERTLGAGAKPEDFRRELISRVAAWAIDHPGEAVPYASLFPQQMQKLKEEFYGERRRQVVAITRELVVWVADGGEGLDAEAQARAESTLGVMVARFGYCPRCARDASVALLRERFSDG